MSSHRHFRQLAVAVVLLALLELLAAIAEGAEHPAVARIMATGCNGSSCQRTYGSGTLVGVDGEYGIVVTCAHLFRNRPTAIYVAFDASGQYEAKLVGLDEAWDLAVLRIKRPPAEPIDVAAAYPKPGDPLQSCGYGSDGTYWCNAGRALGYARTASTATYETLELSGRARDGDSGGPVFNERGELAGVLWGTDGKIVGATYCIRVRKFLLGLFPRLADRFGNRPAQPASPIGPGRLVPVEPKPVEPKPNAPAESAPETTPPLPPAEDPLRKIREELGAALGRIGQLQERIDATKALAKDDVRPIAEEVALGAAKDSVNAPGLWTAILPGLLAALGWTGPPAIAAMMGLKLLGVVMRRRKGQAGAAAPGPAESSPLPDAIVIREDAPPAPPIVRRNRAFIEVEVPEARLRALQLAMDEYVRRHPGARATIETIEAFADQFESGFKK